MIFTPTRRSFFVNISSVIIFCFQSHLKADLHEAIKYFFLLHRRRRHRWNYLNGLVIRWHSSSHYDEAKWWFTIWKSLARKTFDMVLIIKVLSFLKHFLVGFFEVYALVWDKENEMRRVHVHCHGVNNKGRAWRYLWHEFRDVKFEVFLR